MEHSHTTNTKTLRKSDLPIKSCSFDSKDVIEKIRKCEKEIRILDQQESEDKLNVFRSYMSQLKPLFNARSEIIKSIPKFWVTAIEYHPKLTCLITEEVKEVLQYMKKLEVDNTDTKNVKIIFGFEENPYIEDKVIIKEFSICNDKGYESVSTAINWKINPSQNKSQPQTLYCRKRKSTSTSFFTWFCDNDTRKEKPLIVNCFEEIWQNPLPFFLLGEMDSEVEDFVDVDNLDNYEDETDVFGNDDSSSETMDDDDCWSEDDEDETEYEEEDSEFDNEEKEKKNQDMNEDNDKDV